METTTWNMIKTNEAYWKFKELGMYDVIKLDGGGSFCMEVNGKTVASTWEDRRINTIISFEENTSNKTNNTNKINKDSGNTINSSINNAKNIIKSTYSILTSFIKRKSRYTKNLRIFRE